MASALTSLERYHKDGGEFLSHIVRATRDETWVLFVSVEIKEQSKPKKFKQTFSARKLMATAFCVRKRVLVVELMQQGTTITSEVYFETLKKILRVNQNKRCGMLTYGILVVLFHNNASPHILARIRAVLEYFNWELFDHPIYSPDLAQSD
jgi:hypothetical protein